MPKLPTGLHDLKIGVRDLRVLRCLLGEDGETLHLTRPQINDACGFSQISGTLTASLNGTKEGSSHGPPEPGLLKLGWVAKKEIDIDGLSETIYFLTALGKRVIQTTSDRKLPKTRDKHTATNWRYREKEKA